MSIKVFCQFSSELSLIFLMTVIDFGILRKAAINSSVEYRTHQSTTEMPLKRVISSFSFRMSQVENLRDDRDISGIWLNHVHTIKKVLDSFPAVFCVVELNLFVKVRPCFIGFFVQEVG